MKLIIECTRCHDNVIFDDHEAFIPYLRDTCYCSLTDSTDLRTFICHGCSIDLDFQQISRKSLPLDDNGDPIIQ